MNIELIVERAEELETALRKAPDTVVRHLTTSVAIIARDIQEEARDNHKFVARHGGHGLEGAIESTISGNGLKAEVGVRANRVPYGSFVHDGTRPHQIKPRNKKSLRWTVGGGFVFAKGVIHPGTAPDPFLTDAADKVDAQGIFSKHVDEAIKEIFG